MSLLECVFCQTGSAADDALNANLFDTISGVSWRLALLLAILQWLSAVHETPAASAETANEWDSSA